MRATVHPQIENELVVGREWRFAPGAETGQHVHARDSVVVPLTTGTLRILEPEGVREVELQADSCYACPKGVAHDVIHRTTSSFASSRSS